jgi:hypothetical protein
MTARWVGEQGRGAPAFRPEQERAVVSHMRLHVGPDSATSVADVSAATGVLPRTVRAILAKNDGEAFVLRLETDGVLYVADEEDQARHTTDQLFARAYSLLARARKRDRFWDVAS